MTNVDTLDIKAVADRLASQAQGEDLRITAHAHQEMVEENIVLDDVLHVLCRATVVENYPDHKRGPVALSAVRARREGICMLSVQHLWILR